MGSDFPFVEPPDPSNHLPFLKVIRTPATGATKIVILSNQLIGVRIHRVDGGPFLCPVENCPVPECPNCGRFQSYGEIMIPTTGQKFMFEFTAETTNTIRAIQVEHEFSCRGFMIVLERTEKRAKSPISVQLLDVNRRTGDLPAARDMVPFIRRLFNRR